MPEETPGILDGAFDFFDDAIDYVLDKGNDIKEFLDFDEKTDNRTDGTTLYLNGGGSLPPVNNGSLPQNTTSILGGDTMLYIVGGFAALAVVALLVKR